MNSIDVQTLFINCHELILKLKVAQEKQHLESVMRRYERYDLLIIDELGYLPISAEEEKLLFQLAVCKIKLEKIKSHL